MCDSIGKQLRNQREQKNIQLQEVTDELHIRIEYLQALENDEPQNLPSDVQAKGFLRLYASFLELNSEKLISQWNGIEEPENERKTSSADESNDNESAEQSSLSTSVEETDLDDNRPINDEAPSSHQLLEELGLFFKQQRKILQLSYTDVEQATHIRKTILESIEENRFNELPSSVQAKGMLENYAAFMNMDVDHTLELYAEALLQKRIETQIAERLPKNRKNEKSSKTKLPIRKLFTPDLIIGSSLIILVLVIAILSIAKVVNTNQERLKANSFLTQTNIIENSPTSTSTFTPSPEPTESDFVEEFVPPDQTTQNIESPEDITTLNNNAKIQLHLTTNQRAWLQVIADEEIQFSGRVLPGSAYQFYADEKLEFTTGNAAAFSAILIQNGEQTDLGILGVVGQVINFTILPESIITPTAVSTATPTITNTPPPTPTLTPASD